MIRPNSIAAGQIITTISSIKQRYINNGHTLTKRDIKTKKNIRISYRWVRLL